MSVTIFSYRVSWASCIVGFSIRWEILRGRFIGPSSWSPRSCNRSRVRSRLFRCWTLRQLSAAYSLPSSWRLLASPAASPRTPVYPANKHHGSINMPIITRAHPVTSEVQHWPLRCKLWRRSSQTGRWRRACRSRERTASRAGSRIPIECRWCPEPERS